MILELKFEMQSDVRELHMYIREQKWLQLSLSLAGG